MTLPLIAGQANGLTADMQIPLHSLSEPVLPSRSLLPFLARSPRPDARNPFLGATGTVTMHRDGETESSVPAAFICATHRGQTTSNRDRHHGFGDRRSSGGAVGGTPSFETLVESGRRLVSLYVPRVCSQGTIEVYLERGLVSRLSTVIDVFGPLRSSSRLFCGGSFIHVHIIMIILGLTFFIRESCNRRT